MVVYSKGKNAVIEQGLRGVLKDIGGVVKEEEEESTSSFLARRL
jgi:hypothetical protein